MIARMIMDMGSMAIACFIILPSMAMKLTMKPGRRDAVVGSIIYVSCEDCIHSFLSILVFCVPYNIFCWEHYI